MTTENNRAADDADTPTVLVVDDQASVRLLLRQVLTADKYRIEEAENGAQALKRFPEVKPDMVLLDCVMPGMNGIDLCRLLKQMPGNETLPVLMITTLEDEGVVERAFEAGVTDYVTKPINFAVLRQRVRYLLQAGRAQKQIQHMAYHDGLTGLPNRALLMDRLRHGVARAARQKSKLGLMFIDLDQFKWVNDTLGYEAGDELLQQVGARLQDAVRNSDTVARLGSDEFVLLLEILPRTHDAATTAQKVLEAIQVPIHVAGREVRVGGSVGIALYPEDGFDPEQLITRADTAMYRAKEGGRNRFQFYTADMGEAVKKRLSMLSHLRHALAQNTGLTLHYQPVVDLRSGQILSFEVLVRWQHPEFGLLRAGEFLALAEETGLVRQLDEHVLRLVCAQLAQWRRDGIAVPPVSVNFSAHHFQEREAVSKIARILEESGALGENLVLEISEHVTLRNETGVELALNAIKELGMGLCVDDFGIGHTSIGNLKRYPIDSLKIDKLVVQGLGRDEDSFVLVRGILSLAREFHLDVIAEGVESQEQAEVLRALGCLYVQGYHYGQPVDAAQAVAAFIKPVA